MKKVLTVFVLALCLGPLAQAQSDKGFTLALGGGGLVSLNENSFSYSEFGHPFGLLAPQGTFWVSYNFNRNFGLRLSASYGGNSSAKNTRETAGHSFYPYAFNSVNGFLDVMFDVRNKNSKTKWIVPNLYLGAGVGHSFGMHDTNDNYHWQHPTDPNTCFGMRAGIMLGFPLGKAIDLYVDGCVEAYTDAYNGLMPGPEEIEAAKPGYPGFPFDLRCPLSVGVRWRL